MYHINKTDYANVYNYISDTIKEPSNILINNNILDKISLKNKDDILEKVLISLNIGLCDLFNIYHILVKDFHDFLDKLILDNIENNKNEYNKYIKLLKVIIGKIILELSQWENDKLDFIKKYKIKEFKILLSDENITKYSIENIKCVLRSIMNRFLYTEILINDINKLCLEDKFAFTDSSYCYIYNKLFYYERKYIRSYLQQTSIKNSNTVYNLENINMIKDKKYNIWLQRYTFNSICERILEIMKYTNKLSYDINILKELKYKLYSIEYILNTQFVEVKKLKEYMKEKRRLRYLINGYNRLFQSLNKLYIIDNKYIHSSQNNKKIPTTLFQILGLLYEKILIEQYNLSKSVNDTQQLESNGKIFIDYENFGVLCNVDCINKDKNEYIELKLRMNDDYYFKNKKDFIYKSKRQFLKYGCQIATLFGAGLKSKLYVQYYSLSTQNIDEALLNKEDITNLVIDEIKPLMNKLLRTQEENIHILCNNFNNYVNNYFHLYRNNNINKSYI